MLAHTIQLTQASSTRSSCITLLTNIFASIFLIYIHLRVADIQQNHNFNHFNSQTTFCELFCPELFCLLSIPILMNDFCDKSVFPTNQFAISRPRGLPHLRNAGLSGAERFSGLLPQISRPESDHCNYFLDPFNRCLGNHISARISSHISCPSSRSPNCGKGGNMQSPR